MTEQKDDFKCFLDLSADEETIAPPQPILKDLVGSKTQLILRYTLASILGYLASLMICAQCSLGLTSFAWKTSALVHNIPDPYCPLVCGAIFGIFPFVFSTFGMSRFQHRYLLFRMTWLPLILPILANIALSFTGVVHGWEWHVIWFLAAAGTPYLMESLLLLFLRQKTYRSE